jgi:RimJ/RimL family protein N-acetyltransferase
MEELPGFNIRYSHLSDEKYLKKWLELKECERWFPMSGKNENDISAKNWIGFSKYKASLTATLFSNPCAIGTLFLMPYKKVSHQTMFYIIVDPKHWRKGIGSSLLKNLVNLAKNYFHLESINCEVFEGCSLIPLLKKSNFEQFAYQEKYVKTDNNNYLSRILFEHYF